MARKTPPLDPDAPFASSWWALRWISLLESFGWASRLSDGRQYARAGNVLSLEIDARGVRAEVIGSASQPYSVRIALRPLPSRAFEKAVRAMAGKASFAASLLSGRIPDEIETAFEGTGCTLLPRDPVELKNSCTCPDDATLCKHRAAVFYLLGERFDRDPFLIFLLRGKTRDELMKALKVHRALALPPDSRAAAATGSVVHAIPREPLAETSLTNPELHYKPLLPVSALKTTFSPPEHPDAVLIRLGPPPLADPDAARLLSDLHHAIGAGAAERLNDWEWRRVSRR
jgi:uncharacterized Zn finger protein